MLVKEIMKKNVITVSPEDSLAKVLELFSEKNISGAPVVEKDKIVGVISESDILNFVGAKKFLVKGKIEKVREKLSGVKVKKLMKLKVYYVNESDDISKAVKIMDEKDVNRLPVINSKGKLVGIITRGDIISAFAKEVESKIEYKNHVLETDIDRLLEIVEREREVGIEKVAKFMKTSPEKIEEWAKILEEQNLVKIVYPTFGKPVIKIVKISE